MCYDKKSTSFRKEKIRRRLVVGDRGTKPEVVIDIFTYFSARGAKGQHSAPRGGPPRSWTNDELTKALENVWNRRMTTSQASRVYGIPYNSLLMYVRGKYGKSLKLDKLKETTPAANDNLNTIGNSRSTPKEKATLGSSPGAIMDAVSAVGKGKSKHGSGSSTGSNHSGASSGIVPTPSGSGGSGSFFPLLGPAETRIKEVMAQMHAQQHQAILDHSDRLKELEKAMGPEQAKLLMPFFAAQAQAAQATQATQSQQQQQPQSADEFPVVDPHVAGTSGSGSPAPSAESLAEKEAQVQQILIEATNRRTEKTTTESNSDESEVGINQDENKNKQQTSADSEEIREIAPKKIDITPKGGVISAQ